MTYENFSFSIASHDEVSSHLPNDLLRFTSEWAINEDNIYKALNERLMLIERSLNPSIEEIGKVESDSQQIQLLVDERHNLSLRIKGVRSLLVAKEQMSKFRFSNEVKAMIQSISFVSDSPLKQEIGDHLQILSEQLPEDKQDFHETPIARLMNIAIEEAGNDFINHGKNGREYIVNKVFLELGKDASPRAIQLEAQNLKNDIEKLFGLDSSIEVLNCMIRLPLKNYHNLTLSMQEEIAKRIQTKEKVAELFSLEMLIENIFDEIEDEKNKIDELYIMNAGSGAAAYCIDVRHITQDKIQINN